MVRSHSGELSRPDSHGWTIAGRPIPAASRIVARYAMLRDETSGTAARRKAIEPSASRVCRCISSAAAAWTGGCVIPDVATCDGACGDRRLSQKSGPGK